MGMKLTSSLNVQLWAIHLPLLTGKDGGFVDTFPSMVLVHRE